MLCIMISLQFHSRYDFGGELHEFLSKHYKQITKSAVLKVKHGCCHAIPKWNQNYNYKGVKIQ